MMNFMVPHVSGWWVASPPTTTSSWEETSTGQMQNNSRHDLTGGDTKDVADDDYSLNHVCKQHIGDHNTETTEGSTFDGNFDSESECSSYSPSPDSCIDNNCLQREEFRCEEGRNTSGDGATYASHHTLPVCDNEDVYGCRFDGDEDGISHYNLQYETSRFHRRRNPYTNYDYEKDIYFNHDFLAENLPYESLSHRKSKGQSTMNTFKGILLLFQLCVAIVVLLQAHANKHLAGALTSPLISNFLFERRGGYGITGIRAKNGFLISSAKRTVSLPSSTLEAIQTERSGLMKKVKRAATISSGRRLANSKRKLGLSDDFTYIVELLATPGRDDLTDAAVNRLEHCNAISFVRVNRRKNGEPWLRGDTNRWREDEDSVQVGKHADSSTNAVLILADDLAFTCEELDRAFGVWKKEPERMVGFYTYDFLPKNRHRKGAEPLAYDIGEVMRGKGKYSIVSNRAAFVHKSYLTSMSVSAATDLADKWQQQRVSSSQNELEDTYAACKSISLSLAITAISNEAPIAVAAHPLELRDVPIQNEQVSPVVAECVLEITSALDLKVLPSEERIYVGI